ncbi:hypothetical protein PLICRDRAFT_35170 [Plicaturopsis crispa FD-325 SS-3]|nr:hypothetical protein PLICRDRAFT_35170 [Plicaturopsis crispa FD-325 SS-3]
MSSISTEDGQIARTESLFAAEKAASAVPPTLARAAQRLEFPPSYVVVGAYRLFTDRAMYVPAWDKCRHATRRGLIVAAIWAISSYKLQKVFIKTFLVSSTRITGLRNDTIFGYQNPFDLPTYATILFLSSQVSYILLFFLRRNIGIARTRAWDQTVASRGKGSDFWGPYVEEWDVPPNVDERGRAGGVERWLGSWVGRMVFRRVILLPFALNPLLHILLSAGLRSLGTARYLHKPYFEAKKMSPSQVAVFLEERKWDYRIFGFAAALFEGLPIIGLIFSISNRVGAAMWAHDLEKRQHYVAQERVSRQLHG